MAFSLTKTEDLSWVTSDRLPAKHLFTRRLGGVGDYPYSSNYDPVWLQPERQATVRAQWLSLIREAELPEKGLCFTHQIHGTEIRYVTESEALIPPLQKVPTDCDGLITDRPGVALCIFTADCVPVLLCDLSAGLVCAVHSGWKGTVQDMMGSAVRKMCSMGAKKESIYAAVGPAISQCCFECGGEVKDAIETLLGKDAEGLCPPEAGVPGKYMIDLKETNARRLVQLGVKRENIDVSPDCTMCMQDVYWSHRATHGVRGTQAAIIML